MFVRYIHCVMYLIIIKMRKKYKKKMYVKISENICNSDYKNFPFYKFYNI